MTDLPGYDDWKTHNPDDDRCEFCGDWPGNHHGWQPGRCTGECGRKWRDPDRELEEKRDREYDPNVAPSDDAEFGMKP